MYIKVEQMSKRVVYNESQFSHSQTEKLQVSKEECCNAHCSFGLEMKISV